MTVERSRWNLGALPATGPRVGVDGQGMLHECWLTSVLISLVGSLRQCLGNSSDFRFWHPADMDTALENVRFWHLADINVASGNVRSWG